MDYHTESEKSNERLLLRIKLPIKSLQKIDAIRIIGGLGIILFVYAYSDVGQSKPILYDDPSYLDGREVSFFSRRYWLELFMRPVVNLWHPLTVLSHDCLSEVKLVSIHHVVNMVLHMINGVLLHFWIKKLSSDRLIAISTSLIWLLHPVVVESTAWVSGLKDLLCFCFTVSAMLASLLRNSGLAFTFGLLAVFSKPLAVVLPLILFVQDIIIAKKDLWDVRAIKSNFKRQIPLLCISLFCVGYTIFLQSRGGQGVLDPRNLLEKETSASWALIQHVSHWLWPKNLRIAYLDPTTLSVIYSILGFGFFTVFVVLISSQRTPIAFRVGLCVFFFFLLPTLGFVRAGNSLVADRYMYISGVGLTLCVVYPLAKFRKLFLVVLPTILIAFGVLTHKQRSHWKSTEALFLRVISVNPSHSEALSQLGVLERQKGNDDKAKVYFSKALMNTGESPIANLNLGQYALEEGRLEQAYNHFIKTLKLRSNEIRLQVLLVKLAWKLEKRDAARAHLEMVFSLAKTQKERETAQQLKAMLSQ